ALANRWRRRRVIQGATGRSFESRGGLTSVCGTAMVEIKQNELRAAKAVVVIYEDASIRERAVHFCGRLIEAQRSPELNLEWWSFPVLSDSMMAHSAVEKAARADVVVF